MADDTIQLDTDRTSRQDAVKFFNITTSQGDFEAAMVAAVTERFTRGVEHRRPFEYDWMRNVMFVAGYHWMEWVPGAGNSYWRLRDKVPSFRVRTVENRALRLVQAGVALLVGHRPIFDVMPGTEDQVDREKAITGGRVLEGAWDNYALDELMEEAVEWMLVTGIVGVKTFWDENVGKIVPIQEKGEDGKPMTDDRGLPVFRRNKRRLPCMKCENRGYYQKAEGQPPVPCERCVEMGPAGDFSNIIIPPYMWIPDPAATRPADQRWGIHHPWRPESYIGDRWPDKDVPTENANVDPFTEMRLRDYFSSQGRDIIGSQELISTEKGARVLEMIVKPNKTFPKGCLIHVAGNVLLDFKDELDQDLIDSAEVPDSTGLGVEFARCFPVGGRFWPTSLVDHIMQPNKALDKLKSDMLEVADVHGRPMWLSAIQAKIPEGNFKKGADTVIQYNYPHKPERVAPPPLPSYLGKFLEREPVTMQELAGIHQATLGQAPGDLRSGVAISLVQEQDEVGWVRPNREKERLVGRMGRRMLALIADNYTTPRLVQLAGRDTYESEIKALRGEDIKGSLGVKVREGSTTRRNKAANRATLTELLQSAVGPALTQNPGETQGTTMHRLLEAFDMGDMGMAYNAERLDMRMAQNENRLMQQGKTVQMKPYENKIVHLHVHGDCLKSASTQEGDPEFMKRLMAHWQETGQKILEENAAAAGAGGQQPPQGQPKPQHHPGVPRIPHAPGQPAPAQPHTPGQIDKGRLDAQRAIQGA